MAEPFYPMTTGAAPTSGTFQVETATVVGTYRGAPAGQVLADTTNGVLYKNTGDANRPVWSLA